MNNCTLIDKAIIFAKEKHEQQTRKGTKWPYIVHLYEVAMILKENGADEQTIIAGILHDTVEDTTATTQEIEELFGAEVAHIIQVESEYKDLPYRERKQEHMSRVASDSYKTKMVNCADKLSNLRAMYLDYIYVNNDTYFNRFNGSKEDIKWYYGIALSSLSDLKNTKMYIELQKYYEWLFNSNQLKTVK